MAIKVVLQRVRGEVIDQVLDPDRDLERIWLVDDESFPLLQYIDPYGSTIFNEKQMGQVLEELELMAGRARGDRESMLLSRIKALALHCRDHPHEYLRFVGD